MTDEKPSPSEVFDVYLAEVVTEEAKQDPDWLAKARTCRGAINASQPDTSGNGPASAEVKADEPIIVDDGEDGSVFMDWSGLTGTWSRIGPRLPRPDLPPDLPPEWKEFMDANGVTWYRR